MGGIGNQLFQFAAVHSTLQPGEKLVLDISSFGKSNRVAFISEFELENVFEIINDQSLLKRLRNKLIHLELISKLNPKIITRMLSILSRPFTLLFLKSRYGAFVDFVVPNRIGYQYLEESNKDTALYLGYFQSSLHIKNSTKDFLMSIKPLKQSNNFDIWIKRIQSEKPIILHSRRTDYNFESEFGVLSAKYYKKVLSEIHHDNDIPTWVFSDDISAVKQEFLKIEGYNFVFFNKEILSDTEVFHIMRMGSSYLIANSSFSFWAAFLKFDSTAKVYYPSPWFKSVTQPHSMTPKDWIAFPSDFQ